MTKKSYYKANLKRNFKLLPSVLLPILAIGIVFAVIASAAVVSILNSEDRLKVKLGLVGNTKGEYLGLGIDSLEKYDTSKYELSFIRLDEEAAKKKLENREISAYIVVPKRFVTNLVNGNNPQLTYVSNKGENYFSAELIKEVASVISNTVSPAEAGIYSMHRIAGRNGFSKSEIRKADTEMSLKYISFVLNRNNTFKPQVLGVGDGLVSETYYFCAVVFFFILIWGVFCGSILKNRTATYIGYLRSRGIGLTRQITGEYLAYFTVTAFLTVVLSCIVGAAFQFAPVNIAGFSDITALRGIIFAIKILPALFMISAFQFLLYELVASACGVIIGQFVTAVIFAYLAGCFYPIGFFPISYQKTVGFLPNGAAFSYIRQSFAGNISPLCFITVFAYGFVFIFAAGIYRKIRLGRSGRS